MSDAPTVRRDPFGIAAGRRDAPDVHFVWQGTLNEVEECRIRGPQWKVRVEPGRRREDGPILLSPAAVCDPAVCDKERVSRSGGMVGEPGAIVRPIELSPPFEVWPRLPAQRWHRPDADVVA